MFLLQTLAHYVVDQFDRLGPNLKRDQNPGKKLNYDEPTQSP